MAKNKPYETSLWNTRLMMDPSASQQYARTITPYGEQAAAQTGGILSRLGTGGAGRLYGMLEEQAAGDLSLGGGLNPDEVRAATQGARAGFSARGLSGGPQSVLAEVLGRATLANARRRERQGFAAEVEGMRRQQTAADAGLLGQYAQLSLGGQAMGEEQRQFEINRADTLRYNDKQAAVDLENSRRNAEAQKRAARGSLLGGALGMIGGIFGR
jgi:hypothetical protein